MRERIGDGYYMVHFQRPDVPEAEFDRDRAATFRRMLYAASGDGPGLAPIVPEGGGFLDACPEPGKLPGWLTEHDVETLVAEYEHSGFTGPVNWYRNLDRNWELTTAWHRAPISPPALYVAGDRDLVVAAPGAREGIERMGDFVPNLREVVWLPGCGHWTQQERPAEVNEALLNFLHAL
ncbi:alpha/beta fold hydrolase [Actinomadura yumaensis]